VGDDFPVAVVDSLEGNFALFLRIVFGLEWLRTMTRTVRTWVHREGEKYSSVPISKRHGLLLGSCAVMAYSRHETCTSSLLFFCGCTLMGVIAVSRGWA
jgi:hypothetical protein